MLVRVKDPDVNILIPLPNFLVFNWLTALIARRAVTRHAEALRALSYRDYLRLVYALRRSKWKLRGKPLVEVKEQDGTHVVIRL